MSEIKVGAHRYQIGRLTPKEQLHVVRRLGPFASQIAEAITKLKVAAGASEDETLMAFMVPITKAIAEMTNADVDYVLDTCLGAVEREAAPGTWARIQTRNPVGGADLMFQDLALPDVLQLTVAVIRENLASFFPGAVAPPEEQAAA